MVPFSRTEGCLFLFCPFAGPREVEILFPFLAFSNFRAYSWELLGEWYLAGVGCFLTMVLGALLGKLGTLLLRLEPPYSKIFILSTTFGNVAWMPAVALFSVFFWFGGFFFLPTASRCGSHSLFKRVKRQAYLLPCAPCEVQRPTGDKWLSDVQYAFFLAGLGGGGVSPRGKCWIVVLAAQVNPLFCTFQYFLHCQFER